MKTSLVFLCGIIIMLSACNSNKSTDINFKNMETKIREKPIAQECMVQLLHICIFPKKISL